jgi:hypothetical protein
VESHCGTFSFDCLRLPEKEKGKESVTHESCKVLGVNVVACIVRDVVLVNHTAFIAFVWNVYIVSTKTKMPLS